MAQPTPYARQYSFQSYQVANPNDQLPGQKVDIELNAVKASLDSVLTNMALLQRDDGRLANNSVGQSQLDGALISLAFERPTSWVTAKAYAVDDAVFQSSKLYVCLIAHTSGAFATDLTAVKWGLIIDFTTLVLDAQVARDLAQGYAAAALASKNSASTYATDIFSGGSRWYGSTTNAGNIYSVVANTYTPGVRPDGFEAWFHVVNANTGAIDLTAGAYAVGDVMTSDGLELIAGEWPVGSIQGVRWSATLARYTWVNSANPARYARLSTANTFAAAAAFLSTVAVTGAMTAASTLAVTGAMTAASTLAVTGAATLSGATTLSGAVVASKAVSFTPVNLTDAATIAWDAATGTDFHITLGGNRVLGAFTNGTVGQRGMLRVTQDATGSRTLDLTNAVYDFSGGTVEPVSISANDITEYEYEILSAGAMRLTRKWMSGRNSIGFFKDYDMGTMVSGTTYAQAHTLGRLPALWHAFAECTVAEGGWAVGDRTVFDQLSVVVYGIVIFANATTVGIAIRSSTTFASINRAILTDINITVANWKIVLRIYE